MPPPDIDLVALGPRVAGAILLARDEKAPDNRGAGSIDPTEINNNAIFALFGIIGAAFVLVGIWFFFWAKNGGFYFQEDDWDDYKSTVLRRKGPNGTLLSGATPTTNLGGGSIYKDVHEDDGATTVSGLTGITGITPGASDVGGRERHRRRKEVREKKRREKERERERRRAQKSGRHVGEDGILVDEEAEKQAEEQLRAYRDEDAARVGGLNVQSEGSTWDGSTIPSSSVISDDTLSNQQAKPTREASKSRSQKKAGHSEVSASTGYYTTGTESEITATTEATESIVPITKVENPTKARTAGIRKVYSTADRNNRREQERMRAEARRLQSKGRQAASRRDFSWQKAGQPRLDGPSQPALLPAGGITPVAEEGQSMLGTERESHVRFADQDGLASEIYSDTGTKMYHHPIPELSGSSVSGSAVSGSGDGSTVSSAYVDDRRKQRRAERAGERSSGYRREKRRA